MTQWNVVKRHETAIFMAGFSAKTERWVMEPLDYLAATWIGVFEQKGSSNQTVLIFCIFKSMG